MFRSNCGLLALSALGCGSGNAPPKTHAADMMPAANQSTSTAGSTARGAAGNATKGSGGAGNTPATAGGSGGSSTGGSSSSAGAAAGAPSGGSAGSSGSTGGSAAAGSGASTGGASAEPSDAGATGAADAGAMSAMHEDLGKGDGLDVVLMGDSWMSNTLQVEGTGGGIAPSLQFASGQPYRNYAVQGVMLLSADAFGPAIPTQWDTAKLVNPMIKTVIMTGGGNDVIQNPGLQSDCQMDGDQCKAFRMNMVAALDKLWTQMASDGVEDIIYVRYASQAGMTMMTGSMSSLVPPICTSGKVRCHALDTTDLVNGEIALDNIHPLVSANDRIAKALMDMMQAEGMRR